MRTTTKSISGAGDLLRPERPAPRRRRVLWIGVAVALVAAGSTVTFAAAQAVARNDADRSLTALETSATEIASSLEASIRYEETLVASAKAFIAGNPDASNTQFTEWVEAVDAFERSPALQGMGFAVLVTDAELPAYAARAIADPTGTLAPDGTFEVEPPGERPFYCFVVAGPSTEDTDTLAGGTDYCTTPLGPSLLEARDTGDGAYLPFDFGDDPSLVVQTPVYRDATVPATVEERREAFLGWVGTSSHPATALERSLHGRDNLALELRFHDGSSDVAIPYGDAPADARSIVRDLGGGWSVEVLSAVESPGVLANTTARALLLAGVAASVLLGALVFVLATGRARALQVVRERTDELQYQALHDALTGLPNRVLVTDRLEHLVARMQRHDTAGAILFVDLDGFKGVNDTLGHEAGDQLLQAVAARLAASLRDVDTIGRLGGDEFVVLIDGGELDVAPELVAERLLDVMRQPFDLEQAPAPITITASVGIATGERRSAEELLRAADIALYQAKAAGRNCYETFRSDMEADVRHRYALELDLRSALDRREFRLEYQPVYDLADLTLIGVEALLRWDHPGLGTVGPDDFVPLLESSGLIVEVGRWVLLEACGQAAAWRARGHDLWVSVNISGHQLERDVLVDHVREALEVSGLTPGSLVVEITETALMSDTEMAARRLHELKAVGVHVAIDDFGSGYSSLTHVQRFPVDTLKIDRTFVDAIDRSPESDALIRTLIQLGKDLGVRTLAEGVEATHQIDHLREEEVDHAQGFLLARPLDPVTLEEQLLDPTRGTSGQLVGGDD